MGCYESFTRHIHMKFTLIHTACSQIYYYVNCTELKSSNIESKKNRRCLASSDECAGEVLMNNQKSTIVSKATKSVINAPWIWQTVFSRTAQTQRLELAAAVQKWKKCAKQFTFSLAR